MTRDEIAAKIAELVGSVAEYSGPITPSTQLIQDLNLDSLTRVDVLFAIERAFGFEAPDEDLQSLDSVADIIELVVRANSSYTAPSG